MLDTADALDPAKSVEVHGRAGTCVPIKDEVTERTKKVNETNDCLASTDPCARKDVTARLTAVVGDLNDNAMHKLGAKFP